MIDFLKKWILLILSGLLLILLILYWLLKPVDDVIGAFIVTYYIWIPLISVLTTVWTCRHCVGPYKYFTPLLFLLLGYLWVFLFGDGLDFRDALLFFEVLTPTIIPSVIASLVCLALNRRRKDG